MESAIYPKIMCHGFSVTNRMYGSKLRCKPLADECFLSSVKLCRWKRASFWRGEARWLEERRRFNFIGLRGTAANYFRANGSMSASEVEIRLETGPSRLIISD